MVAFAFLLASGIGQDATREADGTYEFWICRGSCRAPSDPNVFALGTFVIRSDSISRKELDATTVIARPLQYIPGARACFVFLTQRSVAAVESYAGIVRSGLTNWGQGSPDEINISLFGSVDAFYNAELVKVDSLWVGVGKSLGGGVSAAEGFGLDSVYARRIGEPDLSECTREPGPRPSRIPTSSPSSSARSPAAMPTTLRD